MGYVSTTKEYEEDELMNNLNKYILDKTTFNIKYKIKGYEEENKDYPFLENVKEELSKKDYETVKKRMEGQHHLCKISTGGVYDKLKW